MFLKSLEMQGFKSFPDKTVIKLGKGITGVVGPNGSGKSNISDAVRWVLGEQSTKSLRGSKMEDVIFIGTDSRKALGYAEVTLNLDNSDRALKNMDKDDVSVTRRFYRSGDSEYRINGEECRLRDVHELFMDTGLGRDGYSLVSQGKVADLVSARSSKRRDMLEEAAGISHLRYQRTDANRRLEQAEENLVRLRDILAELESRIGPLKTQSEKAQKFLVLSEEKKELEIGLWLNNIETARKGLIDQENKLTIAASQYETVELELERIDRAIEAAIAKNQELTAEIDSLRADAASAEEEAAAVEGLVAVENNTLEHNAKTIERIEKDMTDAAEDSATVEKTISDAESGIEELNKEIEQLESELAAVRAEAEKITADDSGLSEKATELNNALTANALEIADLRVKNSSNVTSIEELTARIENINGVIGSRSGILDEYRKEREQCEAELEQLRSACTEQENSLSGYEMIIETRSGKLEKLRTELDNLNLDIHQKQARIKMLDDLEKNLDGYQGSVKQVLAQAKRGALRGIHGTVSQLITVEGEYAVAIETALGAAIQNIVTDSENDAKRAINFLKDNRQGRATFLPLSSVTARPFTEKGLDDCAGFIDMADKLLSVDPKYDGIISSLLGRTAVVETIDDGIAMAKKYSYRFKIVTLDGQVMNAGGSMTGGSRGQGVGFLSRMNEIEDLRKTVEELQNKFNMKQESVDALTGEIASVTAEYDAVKAEILKAQEEIIRKEGDLSVISGRYDNAAGNLKELDDEKHRSLERIEAIKTSAADLENSIATATKTGEALAEQLAALDEERSSFAEKRNEYIEKQNGITLEIVEKSKDIEAKKETIEDCRRRQQNQGMRVDELNAEIDAIKQQNVEVNARIAEMSGKAESLRRTAAENRQKGDELVAKRTEGEGSTTVLRQKEHEKNDEKERLSNEIARLQERKETMERELNTSLNKLFEEYALTEAAARELDIKIEDIAACRRTVTELRNKIKALGTVNVGAVEEYKEVSERYEFLSAQLSDIEKSKVEIEKIIGDLTEKMAERFREQFRRINNYFGETFRQLFDGGRAELVPDDPTDILECDINIKVQPPGKAVQNIDLLSGGEKGLSAIALLFAILKVTPAPFCIFDEVEAALDDINVTRYAKYVRSMTDKTQFILITHRRGTMEEADILYGVTMQEEGVSKLLELHTTEMAHKLGLT